jgi:aryl-alcohol dehydrogenase-like predicted oxidoreductase
MYEMKKITLKRTGLKVSRVCFGTGRIENYKPRYGGQLLKKAYKKGINFWDTADDYNTHEHVKQGLKQKDIKREDIVLMTKITHVFGEEKVKKHVKKILKELGTDYIDILLLHAVDNEKELKKYLNIIPTLKKIKAVKHIGLSSHKPHIINKIAKHPDIEVVMAPYNYRGFRIRGCYRDKTFLVRRGKMRRVLKKCKRNKKDVVLIKIFANGLIKDVEKAIRYGLKQKYADCIDLGFGCMKDLEEDIKIANRVLK